MKKVLVLIITLFQIFFIIGISFPISDMLDNNTTMNQTGIKSYGLYSLFVVVCSNTQHTLRDLAKLSGLVASLPKQNNKNPYSNDEKTNTSNPLITLTNSGFNPKPNSSCSYETSSNIYNNTLSIKKDILNYLLLFIFLNIFLLLFSLKFFCLNARSTIDSSSLVFY